MRKFLSVTVALFVIVLLSSCDVKDKIKEAVISHEASKELEPRAGDTHTYKRLCELTEERSLEVLECFDKHDKESLMEMFAPAISSNYSLSEQIDKVFAIYDSKSVKYERLDAEGFSSGKKDGVYYLREYRGAILDIELENDEMFNLIIYMCYVDDKNPDMIGIKKIYLKDDEDCNLRIIGSYNNDEEELAE